MLKLFKRTLIAVLVLLTVATTIEAQKKPRRSANQVPIFTNDLPKHAVKIFGQPNFKSSGRLAFADESRVVSFENDGASIIDLKTGNAKKVIEILPRKLLTSVQSFGNRWMVATAAKRPLYQVEVFDITKPNAVVRHQIGGTVSDIFEDGSAMLVSKIGALELVRTSDAAVLSTWRFPDGIRQINDAQFTNEDSAIAINCLLKDNNKGRPVSQFVFLAVDKKKKKFGDFLAKINPNQSDRYYHQLESVNTAPFAFFLRGNGDFFVYDFLTDHRWQFESPGVSILSIDIDKYSGRLVTAGASGFIDTWNPTTGKSVLSMRTRFKTSGSACFSPSGAIFATNTGGRLRVWDSKTGNLLSGPGLEELGVLQSIAISADDKAVAVADRTGRVEIWETSKGKRRKMAYMPMPEGERRDCWVGPDFLSFSNDGNFLLGGSDQTANLANVWASRSGEFVSRIPGQKSPIKAVAWSPKNDLIAAAERTKTVQVISSNGNLVAKLGGSWLSAFLPDGKHVVGVGSAGANDLRSLSIFNLETGNQVIRLIPPGEVTMLPHSLAVSGAGDLIAAAYQGGDLVVWNHETGDVVYNQKMDIPHHFKESTGAVSFSADSSTLAFSAGGREIWLLDAETGKEKLRLKDSGNIVGLAFGKSLLASVTSHHVTLWKPEF